MANFQKHGKNVHGQILTAHQGKVFELGLWGPLDTRTMTELVVTISPPNPVVSIKRAGMVPGQNTRVWQFEGLPTGRTFVEAKDSGGAVWTSVTIEILAGQAASSSWVIRRDQLIDTNGKVQAKYPPSPAIVALIALLTRSTDGGLRAGFGSLESAGTAGNLYEHTSGLALDIYRLASDPLQRSQAHNLIRFFIANRHSLGWRNMFYETWGFNRSGLMGGSPHHNNHIHIDWMDFSTHKYEGNDKLNRSKWTEVTWPPEARVGTAINTEANANQVRIAWGNTLTAPFAANEEITSLYGSM